MAIYTPQQVKDIRESQDSHYDLILEQALETVNLTLINQNPIDNQYRIFITINLPCDDEQRGTLSTAIQQELTGAGWVIVEVGEWVTAGGYFNIIIEGPTDGSGEEPAPSEEA